MTDGLLKTLTDELRLSPGWEGLEQWAWHHQVRITQKTLSDPEVDAIELRSLLEQQTTLIVMERRSHPLTLTELPGIATRYYSQSLALIGVRPEQMCVLQPPTHQGQPSRTVLMRWDSDGSPGYVDPRTMPGIPRFILHRLQRKARP